MMTAAELDLVETDTLIEALARRSGGVVVGMLETRRGSGFGDGTVGHSLQFRGNPYAMAGLAWAMAIDLRNELLKGNAERSE